MTIETTVASVTENGNGVTTVWPFTFVIPYQADGVTPAVLVTLTDTTVSPEVNTVLAPSQYIIAGVDNPAGGTVTYTPALALGHNITITRNLTLIQPYAILNQGFFPNTVEQIADWLTMQIQQVQAGVNALNPLLPLVPLEASLIALLTSWVLNPVNSTAYVPPFAGGVATTIGAALSRLPSIEDFGARTTNADNFAAIQAGLALGIPLLVPAGTYNYTGTLTPAANSGLWGLGAASRLNQFFGNNVPNVDISHDNVTIRDVAFVGYGSGIAVGKTASCQHTKILNVAFGVSGLQWLNNCVWLWDCQDVTIHNCSFISTGYGIIQQSGHTCAKIKSLHNYFEDMYQDAHEFNGAGSDCSDVLIDGCSFWGSHGFPTPATERRFCGLTSTFYVRITNNFIYRSCGDAAIHLESSGGRTTIANNIFLDNIPSGGNDGNIYILNNAADVSINGNWFLQTNAITGGYGVSESSGNYTNKLKINDNYFVDLNNTKSFGGCNLSGYVGAALVGDNYGYGLNTFVLLFSSDTVKISDNLVYSTLKGVYSGNVDVNNGTGCNNITVDNNDFDCETYNVRSGKNTSGTNPPNTWIVRNNKFTSSAGAHNGVLISALIQGWGMGNYYGSNLVNTTIADAPGANTTEKNDFKQGTGLIHP